MLHNNYNNYNEHHTTQNNINNKYHSNDKYTMNII